LLIHKPFILAICFLHKGHVLWPLRIHNSMHCVWNRCLSSHIKGVTSSLSLKSAQQMVHSVASFSPLLNLVLLSVLIISGTGNGILINPPMSEFSSCSLCPGPSFNRLILKLNELVNYVGWQRHIAGKKNAPNELEIAYKNKCTEEIIASQ
jgi:hypothetical protein